MGGGRPTASTPRINYASPGKAVRRGRSHGRSGLIYGRRMGTELRDVVGRLVTWLNRLIALIAGWLLGDGSVKLSDVVDGHGSRQWWTPDLPPGTALRQDVSVLVGPGTFSSGEALAYHLQARGRVTVVGEATPGAADHVLPVRLAPTVLAHVPHAYVVDAVTGRNWEGVGVIPDSGPASDA